MSEPRWRKTIRLRWGSDFRKPMYHQAVVVGGFAPYVNFECIKPCCCGLVSITTSEFRKIAIALRAVSRAKKVGLEDRDGEGE